MRRTSRPAKNSRYAPAVRSKLNRLGALQYLIQLAEVTGQAKLAAHWSEEAADVRSALERLGVHPGEVAWSEERSRFDAHKLRRLQKNAIAYGLMEDLQHQFGDVFTSLVVSEGRSAVFVDILRIKRELRGRGIGRAVMQAIIDYADERGLVVALTPDPYDGSTKTGLRRFYKSLGFVDNKGRNKDFRLSYSMYRPLP